MGPFTQIDSIASVYAIEPVDVVEALRKATESCIEMRPNEELDAVYRGKKLVFVIRKSVKASPEMGSSLSINLESERVVDITKNTTLYSKILSVFQDNLAARSAQDRYVKALTLMEIGSGIVHGEITTITNQGFFVKTSFGEGFCPLHQQVAKESQLGLYRTSRELEFALLKAYVRKGQLRLLLSRASEKLANFIVNENFGDELVLFGVKRKCGIFTKIYHASATKPNEQTIKKLRYLFGGERIIFRAVS